jgi:hypothetical protein
MQKHACTSSPLRPTFVCDINDISGYAPWRLFFFCLHLDQNTPGLGGIRPSQTAIQQSLRFLRSSRALESSRS